VLADAQAIDDLILGARDQIFAFLAGVDGVILERRGQTFEEDVRRFHDMAVGTEYKGFHDSLLSNHIVLPSLKVYLVIQVKHISG